MGLHGVLDDAVFPASVARLRSGDLIEALPVPTVLVFPASVAGLPSGVVTGAAGHHTQQRLPGLRDRAP